jgi:hypothetical protein
MTERATCTGRAHRSGKPCGRPEDHLGLCGPFDELMDVPFEERVAKARARDTGPIRIVEANWKTERQHQTVGGGATVTGGRSGCEGIYVTYGACQACAPCLPRTFRPGNASDRARFFHWCRLVLGVELVVPLEGTIGVPLSCGPFLFGLIDALARDLGGETRLVAS